MAAVLLAISPTEPPPGLHPRFYELLSLAKYVGFGLCVIGLIAAAGTMALAHHRGEAAVEATMAGAMQVLVGVIVIGAATGLVGVFLL